MDRVLVVVVTFVCLCASAASHAQPRVPPAPVRDTSASRDLAGGRATVFGRVTSVSSGQGLRDAVVTLYPARGQAGERLSTRVDAEGHFTLRDVPPGEYSLTALKPGYLPQGLGQASVLTPGRDLLLGAGDTAGPLAFVLTPGGVITGRVTDEHGDPVERAQVRAFKLRRFAKEWRATPFGEGVFTDDLGAYRVHSLPPGRYVVSARPSARGFGHADVSAARPPDFLPTYAPNVASAADATPVIVDAGRESESDIVLGTGTLARVEGRVVDAQGAAVLEGSVALVPRGQIVNNTPFLTRPMHADGTFAFYDVPPGAYMITARHNHAGAPTGGPAFLRRQDVGWIDIDVDGSELSGLTVRTSAGATLRGRVTVEGANASLAGREVRVTAAPVGMAQPTGGVSQAVIAADGSFTLEGVHNDVVLRVNGVPFGWWTRSVTLNGRDVTEGLKVSSTRPIDGLALVISARPLAIRGTVTRTPGSVDDVAVVVFRTEAALWEESPRAAGLATSRPLEDGSFVVTGVRPGRYHVIALRAPQIGDDISDAEFLRSLAGGAQTVDVVEGEPPTVALVVSDR